MYCYCYDFITYITVAAFANMVICIGMKGFMGTSGIRVVVTFLTTIVVPLISFAFENSPLVEAYTNLLNSPAPNELASLSILTYPFLYIANLVFFKVYVMDWREDSVNDIMEKLNGSDPYFARARNEILKKCGYNTLDWGVKNLSIRKFLKLAFKSFMLDIKTAKRAIAYKILLKREQRMRINEEKADLRRKKRFLDTAEI